jgi:hypothetical protein
MLTRAGWRGLQDSITLAVSSRIGREEAEERALRGPEAEYGTAGGVVAPTGSAASRPARGVPRA